MSGPQRPGIRGWCPGALRPMMSGDGLVVRLRPPLGRLSPGEARGIAAASLAHGNGWIDLSSRAALQLRGVREEAHPALVAALAALGLVDADAAAERRRAVVITPFARPGDGTADLARALEEALAGAEGLDLPGKFGFALDSGPAPVLDAVSADIRLERAVGGQLILRTEGAARGLPVTAAEAAPAALALARWFVASGGAPGGRGRMEAHLTRGVPLPDGFANGLPPAPPAPAPHVGVRAEGLLLALAFGQMRAELLGALAEAGEGLRLTPWRMLLLERGTKGALRGEPESGTRSTPRRAMPGRERDARGAAGLTASPSPSGTPWGARGAVGQMVEAVTASMMNTREHEARARPASHFDAAGEETGPDAAPSSRPAPLPPGLILDPADPLLRVTACTGAPGCPQALGPTRGLARTLAPHLPPGAHLHVSGCAKGCAHPGPAPLTLVAGSGGYALVRDGAASAPPVLTGLSEALLCADPGLLWREPRRASAEAKLARREMPLPAPGLPPVGNREAR